MITIIKQEHRPICHDTGIVNVFFKVGMQVHFNGDMGVTEMITADATGCR